MTRRPFLLLCTMLMACAGGAWAQAQAPDSLPPEIVTSMAISDAQKTQIDQFIALAMGRLTKKVDQKEDATEVRRGREMLLEPLRNRGITVPFRQVYGEKLKTRLAELSAGESELTAINALRVAGEVATPESAEVLEARLADPRMAVRFAAVNGIGRTFEAMTAFPPAMVPGRAAELAAKAGGLLAGEQQPEVLDATVRSLISALRMARAGADYAPVRAAALATLVDRSVDRLKIMQAADIAGPGLLRALTAVRDAVTNNNPGMQLTPDGVKKAGELSGHTIAYVVRNIKQFEQPGEPQKSMLTEAETILTAAAQRGGGAYPGFQLADQFMRDPQRGFYQNAIKAIQWLQGPPFSFPVGTFLQVQPGGGG